MSRAPYVRSRICWRCSVAAWGQCTCFRWRRLRIFFNSSSYAERLFFGVLYSRLDRWYDWCLLWARFWASSPSLASLLLLWLFRWWFCLSWLSPIGSCLVWKLMVPWPLNNNGENVSRIFGLLLTLFGEKVCCWGMCSLGLLLSLADGPSLFFVLVVKLLKCFGIVLIGIPSSSRLVVPFETSGYHGFLVSLLFYYLGLLLTWEFEFCLFQSFL